MTVEIGKVYKLTNEVEFNISHTANKKIIEFVKKHSSHTIKVTGIYNGNQTCVGDFVNGLGEKFIATYSCKITGTELERYFTEQKAKGIVESNAGMVSLVKLIEVYKKNGGTKTNPTKNDLVRAYNEHSKHIEKEEAEIQKLKTDLEERTRKFEEMKAIL